MRPVRIFVEQQRHIKFIQDLAKAKCGYTLPREIFIDLIGLHAIGYAKQSFEMNTDAQGVNIVISDGFYGISRDKTHMEEIKARFDIDFEYFILPNNNNDGTLETLLYELIPEKYKEFKRFFTLYERELSDCEFEKSKKYNSPSGLGKINAYLDAVLAVNDKKMLIPEQRDYLNNSYWNIHHKSAEPLARFICAYLR